MCISANKILNNNVLPCSTKLIKKRIKALKVLKFVNVINLDKIKINHCFFFMYFNGKKNLIEKKIWPVITFDIVVVFRF